MDKPIRSVGLYQVRDTVGRSVSGPIIPARHDAAATRIFTDALKDTRTQLNQHPDDFELVFLGTQDEESGQLYAVEIPQIVLTGTQWKTVTNWSQETEPRSPERELPHSGAQG